MQPGDTIVIYEYCPNRNVLMLEIGRVIYLDQVELKVMRVKVTFSDTGVSTPDFDNPELVPLQFVYDPNKKLFRTPRIGSGYVRVVRLYNPECEYIGIRRS